jgi:putative ABC transport system substrate-binding protein
MKRREFIAVLGGAAGAFPLPARAQQPGTPVIGFLHGGSATQTATNTAIFRQALADNGFVEGRNVAIEYRWGENRYDRLPALAAELVQRRVAVLAAISPPAAAAAKGATATIPIVFISGLDPVKTGLVASLNGPGGNVTGIFIFSSDLGPKQMATLAELVPAPALIAVLINPDNPDAAAETADMQNAAR